VPDLTRYTIAVVYAVAVTKLLTTAMLMYSLQGLVRDRTCLDISASSTQ
jgi:hypothetical protein